MKGPITLAFMALATLPSAVNAQNLINSGTFFDPALTVREAGASSGLLNVIATNVPATTTNGSWTGGAGGLIQTRTELSGNSLGGVAALLLGNTSVLLVDAQLYAETSTTGNSLVFRRNIHTDVNILVGTEVLNQLGLNLNAIAASTVNTLVAANAVYNWSASKNVSVPILAGQLYQVSFDVTAAAGLPAGVIERLTFGINNGSVTGAGNEAATLLNVLGILDIGSGEDTGRFEFIFKSSSDLSSLDFVFAADSVVGANLLGGTGARDYLSFNNMAVVAIPEPAAAGLAGIGMLLGIFRRRR